jgi:hypothetical protein
VLASVFLLLGLGEALSADTFYLSWARTYFDGAVDDPDQEAAVWGRTADPDGDGRTNLMEYALGNHPLSGADAGSGITVGLFRADDITAQLEATYKRRTDDPLLRYTPMVSADGVTWQSGPGVLEVLPVDHYEPPVELEQAGCRDRTPIAAGQPRLFRLEIELSADTDADGWADDWERQYFGDLTHQPDPLHPDQDGDGLSDFQECRLGTDPTKADTDGDGLPDGWEARYGLDPAHVNSTVDPDGDGVDNLTEYLQGRNPRKGSVPDTMGAVNLQVFTPLE